MARSWHRRCDAWAKHKKARAAGKLRGLSPFCRNWAVPGKRAAASTAAAAPVPRHPRCKARTLAACLPAMREEALA